MLGRNPNSAIAASMRALFSALTLAVPFRIRETVAGDTSARAATIFKLGFIGFPIVVPSMP